MTSRSITRFPPTRSNVHLQVAGFGRAELTPALLQLSLRASFPSPSPSAIASPAFSPSPITSFLFYRPQLLHSFPSIILSPFHSSIISPPCLSYSFICSLFPSLLPLLSPPTPSLTAVPSSSNSSFFLFPLIYFRRLQLLLSLSVTSSSSPSLLPSTTPVLPLSTSCSLSLTFTSAVFLSFASSDDLLASISLLLFSPLLSPSIPLPLPPFPSSPSFWHVSRGRVEEGGRGKEGAKKEGRGREDGDG